jgi:signal transduction histidine kinase
MVSTLQETIDKLRQVSRQLLSAEEAERRRIAHEIHDELGQTLTALKFSLSMAAKNAPNDPNLAAARQMASAAQKKARTLSHELRPAMLDDMGLLSTLEWYIDRLEQHANLAVSLDAKLNEDALSPELKTTLYRLIIEALTNVRKHAQASSVEIILVQDAGHISLTITDDGQGFNPNLPRGRHHVGLSSMRERIQGLGGSFTLATSPGQGTRITVTTPLKN